MKQILHKIRRVKPLIMSKKANFDSEISILSKIKQNKLIAIGSLRANQQKYMNGANQINYERESGNHKTASILEPALEHVKVLWHESLKIVQELEKEQEVQMNKVLQAQQELKSFEALEEKYQLEFNKLEKMIEQKSQDEIAQNMRQHKS